MRKPKILWLDVETSGLDPGLAAILHLAYMVETGGKVKEKGIIKMKPWDGAEVSDEALAVSGLKRKDIFSWPSEAEGFSSFKKILSRYVDKYDKKDKFVLAGYNIASFDIPFLRHLFLRNQDRYFGSFFFSAALDVYSFVPLIILRGERLENYRLSTVCSYFNLIFKAHDAAEDIRVTRLLFFELQKFFHAGQGGPGSQSSLFPSTAKDREKRKGPRPLSIEEVESDDGSLRGEDRARAIRDPGPS